MKGSLSPENICECRAMSIEKNAAEKGKNNDYSILN